MSDVRPAVYWHMYRCESHRSPARTFELGRELVRAGMDVRRDLTSECDVALLMDFESWESFEDAVVRDKDYRRAKRIDRPLAVAAYVWDMYPVKMTEDRWQRYARFLKRHADRILVPNRGTAFRVAEHVGHPRNGTHVVPVGADLDDFPILPRREPPYVLETVRDYPWDERNDWCARACEKLGVEHRRIGEPLPDGEYKKLVAEAAVAVSSVREASTGGMALVEAAYCGVPVVVPAPQKAMDWNGGTETLDRLFSNVEDAPSSFSLFLFDSFNDGPSSLVSGIGRLLDVQGDGLEDDENLRHLYSSESFARELVNVVVP